MTNSFNSEEIALVSLLDEDDDFIRAKVKDAITKKGLYGIQLLNSQGLHFSSSGNDDLSTEIFSEITKNELYSEFQNPTLNLEKVAYLVSLLEKDYYPFSEITDYFHKIVAKIEHNIDEDESKFRKLDRLNETFFGEEGYSGNVQDYYNINNSLLREVIRTREGIPLTLTIIYMAIAGRVGLELEGLALPGHFMCKFSHSSFTGVIDVFNGGRLLSFSEAHWFLASMGHDIDVEKFPIAGNAEIVLRLLKNFENVYTREKNHIKRHQVNELIKLVNEYV